MRVICNNSKKCTHTWCYHAKLHSCDGSCHITCNNVNNVNLDVHCEDPMKAERIKIRKLKIKALWK